MAEAKQYTALVNFNFRGVQRKKGDVFRITDDKAAKLGDKVELAGKPAAPVAPSQPVQSAPTPTAPLPQTKMSSYKVKEAFELEPAVVAVEASEGVEAVEAKDAVMSEVDAIVELSDEKAAELGAEIVEKVEEGA